MADTASGSATSWGVESLKLFAVSHAISVIADAHRKNCKRGRVILFNTLQNALFKSEHYMNIHYESRLMPEYATCNRSGQLAPREMKQFGQKIGILWLIDRF
jgi:hypothetical protein